MKTLINYRNLLLTIFTSAFGLLFLLLIILTISGKYSTRIYIPWLWLNFLYIPPILFVLRIKQSAIKIVPSGIVSFAILYVISTFIIFFFQELNRRITGDLTYIAYSNALLLSGLILIPLELILIFLIRKKLILIKLIDDKLKLLDVDPKVFISYNHRDVDIAMMIKNALDKAKIPVIIDRVDMKPGQAITNFIENSLKEASVVISIVSNNSLASAWVARESNDTFLLQTYENKRFFACYLDEDFFQEDYTLKTVAKIDKRIKKLQKIIRQHDTAGIDSRDLNEQKTRLMTLRNSLDNIIGRLRNSLCLDVRKRDFDASMKKIITEIKADI
ncbi:toll/interleukin-1 receptor domain-containing protein [Pareuzebyella sediminis]|uniref:toll/interleukin-1 receptor domain-containing protein n=1 Tax=Pareuzebyella sediminis TaxID=2607998 RepID=UPI0011EFE663|nr:toll/interleukin-1 receptor domain-containing protein [Pareuzebyella sediminis]